jgi:hypothetical protein
MNFFWILWGFDAVITMVVLYFFVTGLADGSITSANLGIWFILLLLVAGVLGGSLLLKAGEHLTIAKILLALLAVPGLIYLLFILLVVIGKPRWN